METRTRIDRAVFGTNVGEGLLTTFCYFLATVVDEVESRSSYRGGGDDANPRLLLDRVTHGWICQDTNEKG